MKLHAHGPSSTVAAAIILLLAIIQTAIYAQEENSKDSEENIVDPRALSRMLRAEICASNTTQIRDFYIEIIEEEARNVTYPPKQSKQLSNETIDVWLCLILLFITWSLLDDLVILTCTLFF